MELYVLADRKEKAFGDALVLRRERGFDLHLLVVADERFVDRRAGGGIECFVLGVDVEGEEVPGARPAEVGGRNGLKARENRGGKNRRGGTSQEGESRLGGVGGGGRESVRHVVDLGLWSETPRNRRSVLIQENPRSAGSLMKKFSVSLRQHCARHPLDVQAAPPAAEAGAELGVSVRSHHAFDYTGVRRASP